MKHFKRGDDVAGVERLGRVNCSAAFKAAGFLMVTT